MVVLLHPSRQDLKETTFTFFEENLGRAETELCFPASAAVVQNLVALALATLGKPEDVNDDLVEIG